MCVCVWVGGWGGGGEEVVGVCGGREGGKVSISFPLMFQQLLLNEQSKYSSPR